MTHTHLDTQVASEEEARTKTKPQSRAVLAARLLPTSIRVVHVEPSLGQRKGRGSRAGHSAGRFL